MQDEFRNTTNPRDPDCYGAHRPARPGVPPVNAADDIALAIEELMHKKTQWRFSRTARYGFPSYPFTAGVQGMIFANPPLLRSRPTWVLYGHQMQRGELGSIENAFEGFVNNLEWENE